jgi:CBS domain-containing membrane protein
MSHAPEPHHLLHKLKELDAEIVEALVKRLALANLLKHAPARLVWAAFTFFNGLFTIALLAVLALIAHVPLVFPSLGPTVFMLFFSPRSPASSPRNTVIGHAIGILCGYAFLWAFGLQYAPSTMQEGVNWPRVAAAAFSIATTAVVMILFKVAHPPAAATTLIVSLGEITNPFHLFILEVAVLLLVAQAWIINRLAGIDYPLWSSRYPGRVPEPPNAPAPEPSSSPKNQG